MNTIQITRFKCEICGETYSTAQEALNCERKPVSEDKGVKPGDKVRILSGEGTGEIATVERVFVLDKDWGHYAAARYHHTVAVNAKLDNSWGNRQLTFDSYEKA